MPSDSPHSSHPACFYDAWRIRKALAAYKQAAALKRAAPAPVVDEGDVSGLADPGCWSRVGYGITILFVFAWWLAIVGLWWAALT